VVQCDVPAAQRSERERLSELVAQRVDHRRRASARGPRLRAVHPEPRLRDRRRGGGVSIEETHGEARAGADHHRDREHEHDLRGT